MTPLKSMDITAVLIVVGAKRAVIQKVQESRKSETHWSACVVFIFIYLNILCNKQ